MIWQIKWESMIVKTIKEKYERMMIRSDRGISIYIQAAIIWRFKNEYIKRRTFDAWFW